MLLFNLGDKDFEAAAGSRVAQVFAQPARPSSPCSVDPKLCVLVYAHPCTCERALMVVSTPGQLRRLGNTRELAQKLWLPGRHNRTPLNRAIACLSLFCPCR